MFRFNFVSVVYPLAMMALSIAAVPPASAQTAAVRPATGPALAIRVDTRALSRLAASKPPFINNLVACRNVAISTGVGDRLKAGPLKKFIGGLVNPRGEVMAGQKLHRALTSRNDGSKIAGTESAEISVADTHGVANLEPVSFLSPYNLSPSQMVKKAQGLGGTVWHHGQTDWTWLDEGNLVLKDGVALLATAKPTGLLLGKVTVNLKSGVVVLIKKSDSITRIVNLLDRQRDAVVVQIGDQSVSLRPGRECVIGDCRQSVESCKQVERCGRRFHRAITDANSGTTVSFSEVSIASLLKSHSLVRQLYGSVDKTDRHLTNQLVKMAACLAHCSKNQISYSWAD